MKPRWRDRIFGWWAGVVTRHPVAILLIAAALAAASIGYSAKHWKFQSNRNYLISNKLEWNRRYIDVQKRFPGGADMAIVVDAGPDAAKPASRAHQQAEALVEELGLALRKSPLVAEAIWKAKFSPKALRLASLDLFQRQLDQIRESKLMLASPTPEALIGNISRSMMESRNAATVDETKIAGSIGELNHLLVAMGQVLQLASGKSVDFGALVDPSSGADAGWRYLASENGRLYFLRVTPRISTESLDAVAPALAEIRGLAQGIAARYPQIEVGVTGIDVMEADETEAATWDSTWTAALAAVLITALLITAYHSWRTPLFAMIALLVGIAWSYGFLFLAVGHLQVLSVVFNVMLLGLGIAYGIYLASAFELLRHDFPDDLDGFRQTLARTLQTMGPGIATGAITTAAAFATTIFTDFTGVAEMGLIAGVGILLCFLAMFTIFPALLRLFKPSHAHIATMESRHVHFFEERWAMPFVRHPVATLVVAGVLTALSLAAILQMKFDYDLLKLQPRNAPSVQWAQRIVRDGGQPIWYGLSVAPDLDTARQRAAEFRRLPTVGGVGGIGLLFPENDDQKIELIRQARRELEPALSLALAAPASAPASQPASAAEIDLFTQLGTFRQALLLQSALVRDIPAPIRAALSDLDATLQSILVPAQALSPEQRQTRVAHLREAYQRWRGDSARQISQALDPSPLGFDDLPFELLRSYRDKDGAVALEVYPDPAKKFPGSKISSPLDPRFLPYFIHDMEAVDSKITGVVAQIYRSGILIRNAYQVAGILALGLVFLIVFFDYRSLRDAALILLPVAMAFAITFGLMWLAGMQINAANIIVLPLMFGIGVDSGVHVLNRYRQNPDLQPVGLTNGTGKGITVTCLTSVISFAMMTLSSHRGIASLGFVLAVGLTMTMLACWTVMPAWLEMRLRSKRRCGIPIVPQWAGELASTADEAQVIEKK